MARHLSTTRSDWEVLELYQDAQRMGISEVARKYGTSRQQVRTLCDRVEDAARRRGIPIASPRVSKTGTRKLRSKENDASEQVASMPEEWRRVFLIVFGDEDAQNEAFLDGARRLPQDEMDRIAATALDKGAREQLREILREPIEQAILAQKGREYYREYYAKNREKMRARDREYYAENSEKIRARHREYYREYYAKNREKELARQREYRARKKREREQRQQLGNGSEQ